MKEILKKIVHLKWGILFGSIFIVSFANGQTDFKSGYVIKEIGDTLFGEIDYRGDIRMSEVCRFRENSNASELIFSPQEIYAYRFAGGKYFISKEINGAIKFMEYLINGQVNIYYLRDSGGDHYYIDKNGERISEMTYEETVVRLETDRLNKTKSYLKKSKKHIGLLKLYMQDAPGVQNQIINFGKPNHKNLIKIAENYHNEVCDDGECIIYEKKLPPLKIELEVIGGLTFYNYEFNDLTKFKSFGIITHIWLPRTNEKLFLRTGVFYSAIDESTISKTKYGLDRKIKVPVQIEYLYPEGIIKPKFAFGINVYGLVYTFSLMAGFNVKLNKSFYLTVNYDIDFVPKTLITPGEVFSQALHAGIQIKF